jgi:hypothetical protein
MAKLIYVSNVSLDDYIEDEHPLGDRLPPPVISPWGRALAAHALKAGLLDECHLFIRPVLVGGLNPALPPDTRVDLELLDDRRLSDGVVYLATASRPERPRPPTPMGTRSARRPSECDHGGIGRVGATQRAALALTGEQINYRMRALLVHRQIRRAGK